jgi:hypothetical protein
MNRPERRAQVMRHGIRKRFQLLVGRLQLVCPVRYILFKLLIEQHDLISLFLERTKHMVESIR